MSYGPPGSFIKAEGRVAGTTTSMCRFRVFPFQLESLMRPSQMILGLENNNLRPNSQATWYLSTLPS